MLTDLQILSVVISIVGGIITIFMTAGIPLLKRLKTHVDGWELFMRDWQGEPASPGRDEVPGVMERLNKLDGELSNNHGSSLKDSVQRIEAKLNRMDSRIGRVEKKLNEKDSDDE
jgi:hypothetical protein